MSHIDQHIKASIDGIRTLTLLRFFALIAIAFQVAGTEAQTVTRSALAAKKFQPPAQYMYEKPIPIKALVIGNSKYMHADPIPNAILDTQVIAKFFARPPMVKSNLGRNQMLDSIDEFIEGLAPGDIAVVFYAGHGIQHFGNNYLVPVDSKSANEDRVGQDNVGVHYIMDRLTKRKVGAGVLILDACRTNPFNSRSADGRSFARQEGLVAADAPVGILIAYATAPGKIAWSGGDPNANSFYTRGLSMWMPKEGVPVETLFKRVRSEVLRLTSDAQQPWEATSLTGDLTLRPSKSDLDRHLKDWVNALEIGDFEAVSGYLKWNPASRFADAARLWLKDNSSLASTTSNFAFAPVTGAVRATLTQASDQLNKGELTVIANGGVPVHAMPDNSSRLLGYLDAGQIATISRATSGGDWTKVMPSNWTTAGYISGVRTEGERGDLVATDRIQSKLIFDIERVGHSLDNVLGKYSSALSEGNAGIVLKPIAVEEESPARARALAFSRALALKVALVRHGVDTKRVAIQLPAWSPDMPRQSPDVDISVFGSKTTSRLTVSK